MSLRRSVFVSFPTVSSTIVVKDSFQW